MINLSADNSGVNNMGKKAIQEHASISVNHVRLNMQIWGFSLLELLVVITIIGLLSIGAMQSYGTYVVSGNLTEALGVFKLYQQALMSAYGESNGQFPAKVSDLIVNSYTPLNYNTVNLVYYGVASDGQSAYLKLYTKSIQVPHAEVSAPGLEGNYSRLAMVVEATGDGHFKMLCGSWDNSTLLDLPAKYLPASCNTNNLYTFY